MTDEEIKEYWRTAYCNEKYKKEQLEKENAELKADYEVLSCSVGDFGELQDKLEEEQRKNNGLEEQLTTAKEIIKGLLSFVDSLGNYSGGIFAKAEQFLNCSEKPNN